MDERYRYLTQLLGPKSENEDLLLNLTKRVITDYAHWRRNYFPDDPIAFGPKIKRKFEEETERLMHELDIALSEMRRSFPFHSPRYIAHQQSETTLPSLLGLFLGTLYNTNIVTPESGSVTVDWEVDACNALLRMLGFRPSPNPHSVDTPEAFKQYEEQLRHEFGWCHLTSGGTLANIEALWVARIVTYFPLAVKDACIRHDIALDIKLADGTESDIRKVDAMDLLGLKPNESIYLLGRFTSAVQSSDVAASSDHNGNVSSLAWQLINESPFAPARGIQDAAKQHTPVIFTSGAAHYSIQKAAELLGIGSDAVVRVDMDEHFRLSIPDLRNKITDAIRNRRAIIAVVGMIGTTEEGSVEPIHDILALRKTFETEMRQSFWLHVDGAWGGFIRSLFVDASVSGTRRVPFSLFSRRIFDLNRELQMPDPSPESPDALGAWLEALWKRYATSPEEDIPAVLLESLENGIADDDYQKVLHQLVHQTKLGRFSFKDVDDPRGLFAITRLDHVAEVKEFVRDNVSVGLHPTSEEIDIQWPSDDVGLAMLATAAANSITIDPHKMGYTPYPCGAIAFRNDRIRHFVRQEAPYITSTSANTQLHMPIRHVEQSDDPMPKYRTSTAAAAPFTIEGSRPGSAACSLWLASRAMPFDREHHGEMVRASLLAARSLYEWLNRWDGLHERAKVDKLYELLPYCPGGPDTNIVIFAVKQKNNSNICDFNRLNDKVYKSFSILSEDGDRRHSYSQPFFLSRTKIHAPLYSAATTAEFRKRAGLGTDPAEYEQHGLSVLRATVANPYIWPALKSGQTDFIQDFLRVLDEAVIGVVRRPGDY